MGHTSTRDKMSPSLGPTEARVLQVLARGAGPAFGRARGTKLTGLGYRGFNGVLADLLRKGWVLRVGRNLYKVAALASVGSGAGAALDMATVMAAFERAQLSHWTALHHHGLTDQVLQRVYVTTTDRRRRSPVVLGGVPVVIAWVAADDFFGTEAYWEGAAKVLVSDLERSLLDGLRQPERCGGLPEVLAAWRQAARRIRWELMDDYLSRLGSRALLQRVGVVAERLCRLPARWRRTWLAAVDRNYPRLDPGLPDEGPLEPTWRVRLNYPLEAGDDTRR